MSFLKKMFGKQNPIDEMRQCHARQDWAGVLNIAGQIDRDEFDAATVAEISRWQDQAGDTLAAMNLDEGLWAQKTGNLLRAREDFQLAIEQSRSGQLRERAEQALAALERGELPPDEPLADESPALHVGCNSCAPAAEAGADGIDAQLDEETRMELLLATMPTNLAERYLAAGAEFRQAWLAAQDGDEKHALELLGKVPAAEQNALFFLERGVLMLRSGHPKKACLDLQAALAEEPDLFPAYDALTDVLIAEGRSDELQKSLKQHIAEKRFVGFCWAKLAELHAQHGELEPALAAGLEALDRLDDPRRDRFQPYWATRAHLLAQTGASAEAQDAYARAITLAPTEAAKGFLAAARARLRSLWGRSARRWRRGSRRAERRSCCRHAARMNWSVYVRPASNATRQKPATSSCRWT